MWIETEAGTVINSDRVAEFAIHPYRMDWNDGSRTIHYDVVALGVETSSPRGAVPAPDSRYLLQLSTYEKASTLLNRLKMALVRGDAYFSLQPYQA